MGERKKYLDQQLVTDFAEYRSLYNKLEDWIDLVRPQIRAKFQAGYLCPTKGPYILVVGESSKPAIDWEKEFHDHRRADMIAEGKTAEEAEQLVAQEMVELATAAGSYKYPVIHTRPNPAYAGKSFRSVVRTLATKLSKFTKPDRKKAA